MAWPFAARTHFTRSGPDSATCVPHVYVWTFLLLVFEDVGHLLHSEGWDFAFAFDSEAKSELPQPGAKVIDKITSKNIRFGLLTLVLLLIAHAAIYLAHEYSHSLMAWSLGWMAHPFGIDYGRPTLDNFLFLGDVGDNVDYPPIFASGHGVAAAMIALSGTVLGNGLLYFLIYGLTKCASAGMSRTGISLAYWLSLMCAGNVWGYIPLRAITTHADIALAAKGLHLSTWELFPFLIVPALYVVYHFFRRMFPLCQEKIAAGSGNDFIFLSALTAFWFFSFFGGDGIDGSYGLISQVLCISSSYVLLPFCAMYLVSRYYPRLVQSSLRRSDRDERDLTVGGGG